jgi:chromatin segregation and condensation protein Rec8/ScpA/Scc1 (kleisin family)
MQASATEVQYALGNLNYPLKKRQLIEEARRQNVSNEAMQILENIPNREYDSSVDVIREFEGFQRAVQIFHNRKYPASKQELVEEAKNLHVRDVIVRTLELCPDKEYSSAADVINECKARLQRE